MIEQIKQWFEAAVPAPTDKNRAVQIGVHYEEVSEMTEALGDQKLNDELSDYASRYKTGIVMGRNDPDRHELLDSLCDQIVTAVGVAHMFGLDIAGALSEVNASNWSKFVDGQPRFDANGKIAKGPDYFKPDLTRYV
jgi:predicted HAD superfamily Cof-like phosphohydrolase